MPKLKNERREKFCHEYIIDSNGAKSAVLAGYSKKTAKQIGSRLLTFIDVAERINELRDKASEMYGISMQMIVDEHKTIAFKKNAVVGEVITTKDKRGSLDSLAKIIGGLVEKSESTVTHNVSPEIKSMLDDIYEDQ